MTQLEQVSLGLFTSHAENLVNVLGVCHVDAPFLQLLLRERLTGLVVGRSEARIITEEVSSGISTIAPACTTELRRPRTLVGRRSIFAS